MPNCLIFYHYQIVNLHQYLQIIFIIYFTENLAILPIDCCFIGLHWSTFVQEFTFAIDVECLHGSLHAKLLMHNCSRAKHAKT